MKPALVLILVNLFMSVNSFGATVYTVGDKEQVKTLPSRFYEALQITEKDYVEPKKSAHTGLYYSEGEQIVIYANNKSKAVLGKKDVKTFEAEIAKSQKNPLVQHKIFYEQNTDKPNQVFLLEWHSKKFVLKNLSTDESIEFSSNPADGASSVFGVDLHKQRYVYVVAARADEKAVMVDGKFYFYIKLN